jgi:hypothetical protein
MHLLSADELEAKRVHNPVFEDACRRICPRIPLVGEETFGGILIID